MNKAFVLAALLGLAASKSVMEWSYPSSGSAKNLVDVNHFTTIDYLFEFDFGYGSHYMGTDPAANMQAETYGVHAYSYVRATIDSEWFDFYQHSFEFELVPAYYAPYEHTVAWSRIDNGASFALTMSGDWELELFEFTTSVTENMKTFEVSLWDVIDDGREIYPQDADWTWDSDYEHEYDDQYWSFNVLEKLNVITTSESWYGSQNYFSHTWN